MKRALIAFSALSAALLADASAQSAPSQEGPFSEFVYEALGATPSLQFGKGTARAVAPKAPEAARAAEAIRTPGTTAAASSQRSRDGRTTEPLRSAQE